MRVNARDFIIPILLELWACIGAIADELCLIRSMQTDAVNHAPAQILMNTGSQAWDHDGIVLEYQQRERRFGAIDER